MSLAALCAATALNAFVNSAPASGDAGARAPLEVTADACAGLSAPEIQRLVTLELRTVTQEIRDGPPLRVDLRCSSEALQITVLDPLTQKKLERTVPPVPPEPGQERVVALAVAQLFAASWLELLLPADDVGEQSVAPTPPTPADPAAAAAATELVRAKAVSAEDRRSVELLAGVGVRGRSLEASGFPAAHFDVEVRGWLGPNVGLIGRAGFDFGQANRDVGQVRGLVGTLGGGLGWRTRAPRRVAAGGSLVLSGGLARLDGRSARVPTGSSLAGTGQAMASVGPRILGERFRLDVDAEVGGMLRAPVGLVERGDPVSMGGLLVGLTLRVGARLTPDSTP